MQYVRNGCASNLVQDLENQIFFTSNNGMFIKWTVIEMRLVNIYSRVFNR